MAEAFPYLLPLVQNLGLLTFAAVALFAVLRRTGLPPDSAMRGVLLGSVLGVLCVVALQVPVAGPEGTVLDARAGPLVLAGFLGGLPGALIAATLGGLARHEIGGPLVASGVASFYLYALAGVAFARFAGASRMAGSLTVRHMLVLLGLSIVGAAASVLITMPVQSALGLVFPLLPAVVALNAISIFVMAFVLRDLLLALETEEALDKLAATLQKRLEAERRASAAKSRFLANLSQEFRSPLNAVIGLAEVLRRREPTEGPDPVLRGNLDQIHASGRDLLEMIDDIVELAQMEQGDERLPLEVHDPGDIIRRAAEPMRAIAEAVRVRITIDVATGRGVLCQPGIMAQCLINLLSNALRHAPRESAVVLGVTERAGEIVFSVRDGGPGIPPEVVERLSEPFLHAGDARKRLGDGVGLGLVQTRSLVERQGGILSFRVGDHGGTTALAVLKAAPEDGSR